MIKFEQDIIKGRQLVLEVLCMTTLRLMLTAAQQGDQNHQKAIEVMDAIEKATKTRLEGAEIDAGAVDDSLYYLDDLLGELSGNLGLARPKRR
jgi:hypothetical protein